MSRAKTSLLCLHRTDDDGAATAPLHVRRDTGRGPDDNDPVHPHRAGAERTAQPSRTELQPTGEPLRQRRPVVRDDQCLELCAGVRVGVLGQPRASLIKQGVGRHSACTTWRSSWPMRSADALPAARTSSWSSGSPVMPAAMLVTSERPRTSAPPSRAAIASSEWRS